MESQLQLCQMAQHAVPNEQRGKQVDGSATDYANQVAILKRQNSILLKIIDKQKAREPSSLEFNDDVNVERMSQPEKKALEVAVVSLQNLVSQKEKTINRYCQILKSCKQGQKGIVQRLRIDLANLFETLAQQGAIK